VKFPAAKAAVFMSRHVALIIVMIQWFSTIGNSWTRHGRDMSDDRKLALDPLQTLVAGFSPEIIDALGSSQFAPLAALAAKLSDADRARVLASIDPAKIYPVGELAKHLANVLQPYQHLAKARATRVETADAVRAKPLSEREKTALRRQAVIRQLLNKGQVPGDRVTWEAFCDAVRDKGDGWKDRKKGNPRRGYGNTVIREDVGRLK
jgi:hypothetical protein